MHHTTGSNLCFSFFFWVSSGLGNWILSGAGATLPPRPSTDPQGHNLFDVTPLDLHMGLTDLLVTFFFFFASMGLHVTVSEASTRF